MDSELDQAALDVVKANEEFGAKFYQEAAKEGGNILVCPLSAETILALTYCGAGKNTAKEFVQTLQLSGDKDATVKGFNQLANVLSDSKEVTMKTANKIYLQEKFEIKPEFKKTAIESFLADIENVNFGEKVEALKKINNWCAEKTNQKIKTIFDDLDDSCTMVLLNAIYFLGNWAKPFHLHDDDDMLKFHINETETVEVKQMTVTDKFWYKDDEELNAQILELPYENPDYSLVIVLPKEINGLASIESKLPINLDRSNGFFRPKVNVTMPPFKLEKTIGLKKILQNLGLNEAFTEKADFSGISDIRLYISEAIQKTFIDVNEKGTEAAAVTGIQMMPRCLMIESDPINFEVDRPFIFFLRQKKCGTNIFMGRCINF